MPSVSSSEHFTEEVYHIFHRGFFFSVFFFPVFRESADMQCPEKNTHTHTNKQNHSSDGEEIQKKHTNVDEAHRREVRRGRLRYLVR